MRMGRIPDFRFWLMVALTLALAPISGSSFAAAVDAPLKLVVSVEEQSIPAPYPARITLHLHNSSSETLWLYRHARAKLPPPMRLSDEDTGPQSSTGGSTISVRLEPASTGQETVSNPAQAEVFDSIGLPKPALVAVAPGDDYEEKVSVRLTPALSEIQKPFWGTYRLTLSYKAEYSNADEIQRGSKAALWQGEVSSNTIEVQLQPPTPDSHCDVSGTVDTPDSVPIGGALVSLSDKAERLVDQTESDPDGKYSFSGLPPGFYWVTARRHRATEATVVFRHVELTASTPSMTQHLVLIQEDAYEPKQMLHKPVLFRITDNAGTPMERVEIDVTYANGDLVDNVKGQTGKDGVVALALIPGRNFVTLKRKGCPKQDERADVAPGGGIGAFQFAFSCAKK
jgi:hypothetical protein